MHAQPFLCPSYCALYRSCADCSIVFNEVPQCKTPTKEHRDYTVNIFPSFFKINASHAVITFNDTKRFEFVKNLGFGGIGDVYLCADITQPDLPYVALKQYNLRTINCCELVIEGLQFVRGKEGVAEIYDSFFYRPPPHGIERPILYTTMVMIL
jgi:hypothetical protein